ncbi:hypothetical protein DACRYDRAFT_21678 [Dacryopinax primogenitus]|uniref:N-acetyltransferase domain-containing protein n=1 Tax=Dacryopinax primogenitus (strain DJM 731) TaxID=1858805 RepID=M5G9U2_DACPD|nr:uncharacterized protein DACRYDRAFT_21678 [Dacryopinax primogenitus]EJU02647.1 hypothetical protein DACRYDRAFT_21678 [Dacryopinax primogenitus]
MKDLTALSGSSNRNQLKPLRQPSSIICVNTHFSARDMLLAAGPDLEANPVKANLILSDAVERQVIEGYGEEIPSSLERRRWWDAYIRNMGKTESLMEPSNRGADGRPLLRDAVYISVWTLDQNSRTLDFLIACTGRKPVFVFTNHPSDALSPAFLERRLVPLAERMKQVIAEHRVFSIVGLEPVTAYLASVWETLTGHYILRPAYYEATHTFCTRQTLARPRQPFAGECRMGLATEAHITQAGRLCSVFTDSAHDDPYKLSVKQGIQEASYLIGRKELYVCEAPLPGTGAYEVVCIIAVTRKSSKVAAVSKVFTHMNHRRKGYAKHLLTFVCHDVLRTKEVVVLFVGHDLKTAAHVYGRVGFVGVGDRPLSERAFVENWLELGFDNVDIGHW